MHRTGPDEPRGRRAMLAGYIKPIQSWIACPDQDVAYGAKPASGMKVRARDYTCGQNLACGHTDVAGFTTDGGFLLERLDRVDQGLHDAPN